MASFNHGVTAQIQATGLFDSSETFCTDAGIVQAVPVWCMTRVNERLEKSAHVVVVEWSGSVLHS